MNNEIHGKILALLASQENIDVASLTAECDLYDAGLTSFASVQLMLAIEDTFGIEFPERMLNRRTFSTIANIVASVEDLALQKAA